MTIEDIRLYCLAKPSVTESLPFDKDTLVFKVGSKIFALMGLEKTPLQINLKSEPEKALDLREKYPQIQPGYHMSKKHWNTIIIDGLLPPYFIKEMIDVSYNLVIKKMTKKERMQLNLK